VASAGAAGVGPVISKIDDVIRAVRQLGKSYGDDAVRAAEKVLKELPDEAGEAAAKMYKRYGDDFIKSVVSNPALHKRLLSECPELMGAFLKLETVHDPSIVMQMIGKLRAMRNGESISAKVLPTLADADKNQFIQLSRGLSGKTIDSRVLDDAFASARTCLDPDELGTLTEKVTESLINAGRPLNRGRTTLPLKKGTKLVEGKVGGNHGIDFVGVGSNGKPQIVEVTAGKSVAETSDGYQMSAEWVAANWKRFIEKADPEELGKMGFDRKYLDPRRITPDFVRKEFDLYAVFPESAGLSGRVHTAIPPNNWISL
jgi:hypothetical protein